MKDTIKTTGWVKLQHFGPDNQLIGTQEFPNLVVTTGKNYIASRMKDATATAMSHIAVGTGVAAAAIGDTQLSSQLGTRKVLDSTTVSTNSITYVATIPSGAGTGGNLTEAGIFNAATSGTMLARTVFTSVAKADGDTVIISWTITNS